jgi:nitrite reductase (NO-forming)
MRTTFVALALITASFFMSSCVEEMRPDGGSTAHKGNVKLEEITGEEMAVLTTAPNVPPPITRKHATKVIIKLEVTEEVKRLADGVDYTFWTFGGSVPGKFIRVREGDYVEFHLSNRPDSKMPHNIDLHAVTGTGGGAEGSMTAPGHTSTFSFTALNPGLYVYHCAAPPVGMHIANGMYGLILVEPKAGLPKVDKEFYVMQGEFYTGGNFGEGGLQPFDMQKALDERPPYVVFNGSVGSMTGDNTIKAKAGETVRLFVGNGGPNLISSFHVIGEIFDDVYGEGGTVANQHNVQTTLVPAGGSAMVTFKVDIPGKYILVDHSIFRAMNKGGIGILDVSGDKNDKIYSGKQKDEMYLLEGSTIQKMDGKEPAAEPLKEMTKAEKLERGKTVYNNSCAACHQANGQGVTGSFPPLAKADYLQKNRASLAAIPVHGLSGKIVVNGKEYNSVMPALEMNNQDASAVLTYILNNWGNNLGEVTAAEVAKARAAGSNATSAGGH